MTQPHEDFIRYSEDFAEGGLKSLALLSKGAQAIASETTEYTRKSVEAGSGFVDALFSAKSLEDAIDIQASYFRQSYEAFVAESSRISELYAELAKDAYKPFESLVVTAS